MQKRKTTPSIKRIGVSLAALAVGTSFAVGFFTDSETFAQWKASTTQITNAEITTADWSSDIAPTITNESFPNATKDEDYHVTITGEGTSAIYTIASGSLPQGLSLNDTTGVISGKPIGHGVSTFRIAKTNVLGIVSKELSIDVRYAAPTLTGSTLPEAKKDVSYSFTLSGTGEAVTYSLTAGSLPAGLELNASTGVISGTPTVTGSFSPVFTKSNESGTVTKSFTIKAVLAAPVITSPYILPDGYLTLPYSYQFETTGEEIVFSAAGLPAGLTIDSATGILSGVPSEQGATAIRVTATNSGGVFSAQYVFPVKNAPPTIVTTSIPDGEVGVDYSFAVETTGAAITFRTTGTLPRGLTMNSAGVLAGKPLESGTSNFRVIVSNNGGTVERNYSVYIETDGPVISTATMPDATQGIGYNQPLAGKGEDPTYSISAGALPPGLTLTTATGRIFGTATGHGVYNFTVTKTNAKGTATRELSINVRYQAPTITTASLANGRLDTAYSATLNGAGNGATFTISAGALPPGISIDENTGTLSGSPTLLGNYTFTITKTNEGGSATKELSLTVLHVAPKFASQIVPSGTIGVPYEYQLQASGLEIEYAINVGQLPAGISLNPATGVISGTPTETAASNTRVRVSNSGGFDEVIFALRVNHVAPTMVTTELPAGQVGVPYSFQIETTGEALTFSRISGGSSLPSGLTMSPTGLISGTPNSTYSGTYGVTIQNSGGFVSVRWPITIVTQAPTITTGSYPDAILGSSYNQPLAGAGTGNTYSITAGAVPTGTSLNASGTVTGSPNTHGLFTFTVTKTNVSGSVSKEFTIYVRYATPTILTANLPNASLNVAYTAKLTGGGTAVTYSIIDGALPPGLSINETSGDITGAATVPGTYIFTVLKKNIDGEDSRQLSINVAQAPPTFGSVAPGSVYEDQYYEYAFDGTGNEVTYAITSAAPLPAGLSFNTATGVISGTTNVLGTTSVTVTKTNGGGTATKTINLVVKIVPPTITTISYADATVGIAYSQTVVATGKNVTFALAGGAGALPVGLTLNTATGVISGTPTTATAQPVPFTINASNSSGTVSFRSSIAVKQVAPVLTSTAFNIPTKGASFSQTLTATGVAITWSSTGLPAGLALNATTGAITGTPTVYGNFPVIVSVTNSGGTSSKTMNMLVEPRVPVIATTAIPSGAVGVPYSFTMTNSTDPGEWSLLTGGTLPAGLTLNATTGVISGTPTTAGDKTFTIIVENSNNDASKQFTMTINVAPPVITRTNLPNVAKSVAYSQAVTTTGTGVTFTRTAGALPTGFSLNATTGVISGTSTGSGDYNFTITATNAGGATSKAFTIRILQSTQLVVNGGFESGMTNWAWRFPGGDIGVGSSPSNTGSYAGANYARVYEGMLVSNRIAVTPGETLTFSFAHRNVGVLSYSLPYVGIIYYDDLGNMEQNSASYKMNPASVWTPLSYSIVVPAGYKYAEIYFSGDYEGGATTVYDGVSLTGLR